MIRRRLNEIKGMKLKRIHNQNNRKDDKSNVSYDAKKLFNHTIHAPVWMPFSKCCLSQNMSHLYFLFNMVVIMMLLVVVGGGGFYDEPSVLGHQRQIEGYQYIFC